MSKVEEILEHAKGICTKSVAIVGEGEDGTTYFVTTGMSDAEANLLLDFAKHALITGEVD